MLMWAATDTATDDPTSPLHVEGLGAQLQIHVVGHLASNLRGPGSLKIPPYYTNKYDFF